MCQCWLFKPVCLTEADQRLFVWSYPASELWKSSPPAKGQPPAPWRGNNIFKWHNWQQREDLLVPLLLGHWHGFSCWRKALGQFFCKENCCSYNTGNNNKEKIPDRTDESKGSHHLGKDQVESRLSSVVVVICDKWDWADMNLNKSYQTNH